MEGLFYFAAIGCMYSYFLYPLMLMLIPCREKQQFNDLQESDLPHLSMIIAVHNEESRILEKLENSLQIDYPQDRLDIIVASDCSTDATEDIVASYVSKGVRLVRADEHKGKEYAQWCALQSSLSEIVVFSDVATQIPKQALRILVQKFQDDKVGAVSSEDRFISNDGKLVGEGAYLKYEMWLRRLESDRAGLVGLSGSFFAARREVCEEWDSRTCSDFNTARNCARMGLVAITCPEVVGYYRDLDDPKAEFKRKVRTVLRGITGVLYHAWTLNPFRMGPFAFQVWSHKIMRWAVPWFMLAFAVVTLMLQGQGTIYTLALVAQIAFYALALTGWVFSRVLENTAVRIIFYFVQTNLALAQATLLFLFGKRVIVWTPSKR